MTAVNVTNNVAAINNQPPVVSISSPTKSTAYIAPATITIDAIAFDPDGTASQRWNSIMTTPDWRKYYDSLFFHMERGRPAHIP